ncbi:hypothetical protein PG993_000889 [Apiospora rasikravindrae]|uniref:CENP-V/GFA domain-containing protein n=1 Tax=Apiospora rasikravindrae TaxID=990691 RepID=A0ABR1U9U4_9PEZI
MATAPTDLSKPYIPAVGHATDGYSKDNEATATCFCGTVQLAFPTSYPGIVSRFVCHCLDCRKLTATMFASNFTVQDPYLKHVRGQDELKQWSQSRTIATGNTMTNHFCGACGTLLYRASSGFPGKYFLRIGTVDDFHLHETRLRPQVEQFVERRVGWLRPVEGVKQVRGMHTFADVKGAL